MRQSKEVRDSPSLYSNPSFGPLASRSGHYTVLVNEAVPNPEMQVKSFLY